MSMGEDPTITWSKDLQVFSFSKSMMILMAILGKKFGSFEELFGSCEEEGKKRKRSQG